MVMDGMPARGLPDQPSDVEIKDRLVPQAGMWKPRSRRKQEMVQGSGTVRPAVPGSP